jgi:hypothetical protein
VGEQRSAETIHQGLGAHYTPNNAQKENENSVSKILCADSQGIVINALSLHKRMLRQGKSLPQIRQFFSAFSRSAIRSLASSMPTAP